MDESFVGEVRYLLARVCFKAFHERVQVVAVGVLVVICVGGAWCDELCLRSSKGTAGAVALEGELLPVCLCFGAKVGSEVAVFEFDMV